MVLEYLNKVVLDSTEYMSSRIYFQFYNNEVFYADIRDKKIKIFRKDILENVSHKIREINFQNNEYYRDLSFDLDNGELFLMFNFGVFKTKLESESADFLSNLEQVMTFDESMDYDNIDLSIDRIILSTCYNTVQKNNTPPPCKLAIIERNSPYDLNAIEIKHDAIAFTHLPNYILCVSQGKILITHTLHNYSSLIDVFTQKIHKIGDSSPLNSSVDSIPFNSTILQNSTNAREMVKNISEFAQTIDRVEGGFILSDKKFAVVTKLKGSSMYSKRIISIYEKKEGEEWKLSKKYTFKNDGYSRKYRFFNFHLSYGFKFNESHALIPEFDLPKLPKSKVMANITALKNSKREQVPISIYVFKHEL